MKPPDARQRKAISACCPARVPEQKQGVVMRSLALHAALAENTALRHSAAPSIASLND
jgi:ferritin-like protein